MYDRAGLASRCALSARSDVRSAHPDCAATRSRDSATVLHIPNSTAVLPRFCRVFVARTVATNTSTTPQPRKTQPGREEPRRPVCATRMDLVAWTLTTLGWRPRDQFQLVATSPWHRDEPVRPPLLHRSAPTRRDATLVRSIQLINGAVFGRVGRARNSASTHSSSSSAPAPASAPFGALPLPRFAASLAAARLSRTRWRISANIAGFSRRKPLAFSRP